MRTQNFQIVGQILAVMTAVVAGILLFVPLQAESQSHSGSQTPRTPDGHPDLTGLWSAEATFYGDVVTETRDNGVIYVGRANAGPRPATAAQNNTAAPSQGESG